MLVWGRWGTGTTIYIYFPLHTYVRTHWCFFPWTSCWLLLLIVVCRMTMDWSRSRENSNKREWERDWCCPSIHPSVHTTFYNEWFLISHDFQMIVESIRIGSDPTTTTTTTTTTTSTTTKEQIHDCWWWTAAPFSISYINESGRATLTYGRNLDPSSQLDSFLFYFFCSQRVDHKCEDNNGNNDILWGRYKYYYRTRLVVSCKKHPYRLRSVRIPYQLQYNRFNTDQTTMDSMGENRIYTL
jgi:hypothetical protein